MYVLSAICFVLSAAKCREDNFKEGNMVYIFGVEFGKCYGKV
jgi:hypothetical protein